MIYVAEFISALQNLISIEFEGIFSDTYFSLYDYEIELSHGRVCFLRLKLL